jgi:hypothetical protein
MEYSVEQIKDLYCKFTCQYNNSLEEINGDFIDPCKFCQIDNFIQELKDQKIINT